LITENIEKVENVEKTGNASASTSASTSASISVSASTGASEGFEKAFLMDVSFVEVKGKPAIRLMLKSEKSGKTFRVYDQTFEPYFYVLPRSESELFQAKQALEKLQVFERGEKVTVKRVEETTRLLKFKPVRLLKVIAFHPKHVLKLREESKRFGTVFEADVPFYKRYVIDKGLKPCGLVEVKREGLNALEVKPCSENEAGKTVEFKMLSLDIETYNPNVIPNPSKDPCLMIGYAGDNGFEGVYSFQKKFSKPFVKSFSSEREMLEAFCALLREKHVDLLCTYNGDSFDLPYLQERAKQLKADFRLGRDRLPVKTKRVGMRVVSEVGGRVHYDVLPVASFMDFTGTIKVPRLTLESVYGEVLGGKKLEFDAAQTWRVWDSGDEKQLDFLAEYCVTDARACFELAKHFLYLQTELSKLLHLTLFDVSRATASQLAESLLLRKAFERGELAPNKPSGRELVEREHEPVQGAFVKMPLPGVYDNIAVFDFRSLYPSIIISHNVDFSTLDCDCCTREEAFVSPQGHKFCSKRKGIIPEVLSSVLNERVKIKKALKNVSRDSREYQLLYARQWGLKIFANSIYGLTLHPRFRWYSRAAGESTTAWGRHYIQETIRKAEKEGFRVLYSDTDSIMISFNPSEKEKLEEFQRSVNESLPRDMELELEGFYPRGIFVSKKQEAEKGAKKKYALIDAEGRIKIRGFELVRRDWSRVARDAQRAVLEILLKEGNVQKAIDFVREVVKKLKSGETPLEDCVIYTQLQKSTRAYEVKSPELSAVLKARKAGLVVPEGAVVGYVITRQGKSISEKAFLVEQAKDYDSDYYVNNQVMPAVLKILGALGVSEDDIKLKGSQSKLDCW